MSFGFFFFFCVCVRETITPHRDGRPTKTRGKKKIDHKRHVIDERVGRALYYSGGEHARSPKRRARARARRPCARDEGTTWVDTHRAAGSQWTGRSGRGLFAARGVPPPVRARENKTNQKRARNPGPGEGSAREKRVYPGRRRRPRTWPATAHNSRRTVPRRTGTRPLPGRYRVPRNYYCRRRRRRRCPCRATAKL